MVEPIFIARDDKALDGIENLLVFRDIINNNHRISFTWHKAKGVEYGKRTGYHYSIIFDTRHFKYWEGSAHEPINEKNVNHKIINFIHCLVLEWQISKNYNYEDFTREFGYDLYDAETKKLYADIIEQSARLEKIFSEEELEQLTECFQNY